MGRLAKPNQVRINEGNREHRRLRPEPEHKHGSPERPKLSANALRVWDRLIEDMDPLMLRRADKDALATLCEDEAELAAARVAFQQLQPRDLAQTLVCDEGKALARHIRELTKTLLVERREFGLTPASRTRVMGSGEPAKSLIDEAVFNRAANLLVLSKPDKVR